MITALNQTQLDSTQLNHLSSIELSCVGCCAHSFTTIMESSNVILYLQLLVRSVHLLAMAAVVDECVVIKREGKGTAQTEEQCMVQTACA